MDNVTRLVCPRCDKDDQIRKVSSVVEDGTATRRSGMWAGPAFPAPYADTRVSTDLAELLRMPAPPVPGTSPGFESALGCGGAIALTIVVGIVSAFAHLRGLVDIAALLFFFGSLAWMALAFNRHSEEKERIAKINATWPAKQRLWNDLYYCYRNGVVFPASDPARAVPAKDMARLLGT